MSKLRRPALRSYIVAAGQFPPPVTGYAFITDRMISILAENADIERINLSPGNRQGLSKHLHKSRQTIRACWRISRSRHTPRFTYLGCEGDWGLLYTTALVAIANLCGHTIFLHHHSFSYIDRNSRLIRAILKLARNRIHHIFLCATMRNRFEERYGSVHRSDIVANAAFVESFPGLSEARTKTTPLRIGLLSNLTKEKGLFAFLDLLRAMHRSGLHVQGVLAGPILDKLDRAHVAQAEIELSDILKYVGPVYGPAKEQFYSEIDVFVFPTFYANEAQPTVLFEAASAGKYVIAYDRGCIGTQIESGAGFAVPVTDDFCTSAMAHLKELLSQHEDPFEPRAIIRKFESTKISALRSASELISRSIGSQPSDNIECY